MSLSTNRAVSAISSGTACASCKYQRKKCSNKCLLAPYFPQELQDQFLNAHKLYGVSNITKTIKGVEESQRDMAMRNLIISANARARDPVGGLPKIVSDLKRKLECCQAELNLLHQQLDWYRSQTQQQQTNVPFDCYNSDLDYVMVNDYDNMNMQQHKEDEEPSMLDYEMFLKMSEQTKVKLEKESISDQKQNNLLSRILMASS